MSPLELTVMSVAPDTTTRPAEARAVWKDEGTQEASSVVPSPPSTHPPPRSARLQPRFARFDGGQSAARETSSTPTRTPTRTRSCMEWCSGSTCGLQVTIALGCCGAAGIYLSQDKVFYLFVEDFSTNTTNGVEVTDYPRHFELNEPMGAFLGVIALIFALLYNSIFNDAQQRLASIRTNLAQEAGAVHTAALLVRTLDSKDSINKTRALLLFSDYIECLNIELVEKKSKRIRCGQSAMRSSSTSSIESQGLSSDPEDGLMDGSAKSNIETLYAAVPFLSKIGSDGEGDEMDRVLVQRTVDSLNRVCEARHHRLSSEKHTVAVSVYALLVFLALSLLFGVVFMQTGNHRLQHAMILLSTAAAVISMGVLVDVSQPWRGFIRVDTSIFDDLRQDISVVVGASGASHTRSKGSNKLSRTTSGTSIDYSMELRRAKVRRASIIAVTESLDSPGTARTRGISWHSPRALPT